MGSSIVGCMLLKSAATADMKQLLNTMQPIAILTIIKAATVPPVAAFLVAVTGALLAAVPPVAAEPVPVGNTRSQQ